MNAEFLKLKTRLENLSIDELVARLDQFPDEPTLESRLVEAVLAQKISALTKELPFPKEDAGDATLCPPPITAPSGAAFESAVSRDINSTEKHTDIIPATCKPSPAPCWLPDANILPPHKIHGDGVNAESFSGEVVPGLTFVNPGRQERSAVHTPLASEISKQGD
jgi:hypothetical protein